MGFQVRKSVVKPQNNASFHSMKFYRQFVEISGSF